jgi:16S rRNA (uracil1498-N3)-methyltransferase
MPDFRAYAPAAAADAAEIRLDEAESHHLVAVNRCGRGDPVVAFDGRGREWICECADPAKHGAVLRVKSSRQAPPLPHALTLAQALPKGATMDEIVRQATELGARRIVPLLTERTQVHLDGGRAAKKHGKWLTTAIEAAKQCGNPWVPEIAPVQKLNDFLMWASASSPTPAATQGGTRPPDGFKARPEAALHPETYDLKLVASLQAGAKPLREAVAAARAKLGRAPANALWLVGPEGDFSPGEMTACVLAGCVPVTLGPLVLRCDTAAIAALSVLSHELANG